jgi:2-phospho-L-lactate guanylyltransferase
MSHMTGSAPHGGWQVVVPVKALDRAKSRLSTRTAGVRRSLALAFALDTIAAALACDEVERVLVVGDDEVREAVTPLGADWVADLGDGLNAAVAAGAAAAGAGRPVAALVGDLPALRPDELGLALHLAEQVELGIVADSAGIGTTLLARRDGGDLDPRFGPRSRAAHRAAGAIELVAPPGALAGLRRDVDTEVELWDARRLGVGAATAAELAVD